MTDPWARPTGNQPVVEIELSGGDPVPSRPGDAVAEEPPGRGRRIMLLLAGAAIAAIVVATVTGGGDDEVTEAPTTTFDPALVTTPPTLETLPPATLPGPADSVVTPGRGTDPGVDSPDETFPGDDELFDPATITVPTFDELPDIDATSLGDYDLLAAIDANTPGGSAMRTTVVIEGIQNDGLFNNTARVVLANDPVAGLDSIRIDRNLGETARIVADRATQTVYRTDAGIEGRWEVFGSTEFTEGTGALSVDELFDSLAEGPVNATSLAAASSIEADPGLVRIVGGAIARRWHIVVPIDGLRPYGQLLLTNISELTVEGGDAPNAIEFDAYVTAEGQFALIAARFEVDDIAYSFQQFFDRRPANVRIQLPEADTLLPRAPQPGP